MARNAKNRPRSCQELPRVCREPSPQTETTTSSLQLAFLKTPTQTTSARPQNWGTAVAVPHGRAAFERHGDAVPSRHAVAMSMLRWHQLLLLRWHQLCCNVDAALFLRPDLARVLSGARRDGRGRATTKPGDVQCRAYRHASLRDGTARALRRQINVSKLSR